MCIKEINTEIKTEISIVITIKDQNFFYHSGRISYVYKNINSLEFGVPVIRFVYNLVFSP